MEVLIPRSSYPSTPKRFGDCFFSAPTSPRRSSEFYKKIDGFSSRVSSSSAIPFNWEEKPGTPKSPKPNTTHENDDFAFDVTEETEKTILPAEELFHCGKIKLRSEMKDSRIQNRSPISNIRAAFSPRKKKEFDPFGKVVENTQKWRENERGRERVSSLSSSSSNSGRRGEARSVSPYRVSKHSWEEEQKTTENTSVVSKSQTLSSSSSSKSKRKWRLKDFFLFRSASEGRSLRKYTSSFWRNNLQDHVKNSSFRSVEGSVSGSGSGLKRRGGQVVSAHELHYTMNRAVSEDLKKKTFLPYKQGILGRLAFNPAVHALANGFGLSPK